MIVREATETDRQQWNAIVLSSAHSSFLQIWEWGDVQEKFQIKTWRLIVEDNGKIFALALMLRRDLPFGRSWLYIPRGPIFPKDISAEDQAHAWRNLMGHIQGISEQEKCIFVRMDPTWAQVPSYVEGWQKAERNVQPQHTLILDLNQSEEDLLKGMRPKTRYNVRLAERKGIQVRYSTDISDLDHFLHLSKEVQDRTSFSYHPDEYYQSILEVFGAKGLAELAIAEHEGDILAVHMMIYAGPIATYAHGASSQKKRDMMAPARLYWETIRRAKEKGCLSYDFFGIAPPESDSNHPWSGISRIKRGFGGTAQSYIGSYDYVFSSADYYLVNLARRAKRILR